MDTSKLGEGEKGGNYCSGGGGVHSAATYQVKRPEFTINTLYRVYVFVCSCRRVRGAKRVFMQTILRAMSYIC